MLDQFSLMDFDTRRATLSAMTILSLILWLCILSKWVLFTLTGLFTLFSIFLAYKQFMPSKSLKKGFKTNI